MVIFLGDGFFYCTNIISCDMKWDLRKKHGNVCNLSDVETASWM